MAVAYLEVGFGVLVADPVEAYLEVAYLEVAYLEVAYLEVGLLAAYLAESLTE